MALDPVPCRQNRNARPGSFSFRAHVDNGHSMRLHVLGPSLIYELDRTLMGSGGKQQSVGQRHRLYYAYDAHAIKE
ncbi:hypothetical protein PG993_007175 [Apiospora rasikravindrae]|uniref:Uncharacterized protein n=1 Tax=Apiospora rasikravindrae TaxID=990691 RepID=A0ABR1SYJ6_9PEZI